MPADALDLVLRNIPGTRAPLDRPYAWNILIEATAPLAAWIPARIVAAPSVTIHVRSLHSTLRVGDRVGEATFSLQGRELGRVPVAVSGPPRFVPSPAPRPTPRCPRQPLPTP